MSLKTYLQTFRQEAMDSFSIHVTGPYHCGPDDTTPKTFNYHVELEYPGNALDERGFLLDNLTFREYFSSIGHTTLSCEQLVQKAASDLSAMTQRRATRVVVRLWAIPDKVNVAAEVVNVKGDN